MITMQPFKFRENKEVYDLVKAKGKDILPVTTIDGKIIKTNEYPSLEEFKKNLGNK